MMKRALCLFGGCFCYAALLSASSVGPGELVFSDNPTVSGFASGEGGLSVYGLPAGFIAGGNEIDESPGSSDYTAVEEFTVTQAGVFQFSSSAYYETNGANCTPVGCPPPGTPGGEFSADFSADVDIDGPDGAVVTPIVLSGSITAPYSCPTGSGSCGASADLSDNGDELVSLGVGTYQLTAEFNDRNTIGGSNEGGSGVQVSLVSYTPEPSPVPIVFMAIAAIVLWRTHLRGARTLACRVGTRADTISLRNTSSC